MKSHPTTGKGVDHITGDTPVQPGKGKFAIISPDKGGGAVNWLWKGSGWAAAAVLSVAVDTAAAVQLADGTVYFIQPPRLLEAMATQTAASAWGSRYYFTIQVPENSGEPLQKLAIFQHNGSDTVRFDLTATIVNQGKYNDNGPQLSLAQVSQESVPDYAGRDKPALVVTFSPPVPPGETVTIALHPKHNPQYPGVYLFGVTAFPPGDRVHPQFLGFGRLHFYSNEYWPVRF